MFNEKELIDFLTGQEELDIKTARNILRRIKKIKSKFKEFDIFNEFDLTKLFTILDNNDLLSTIEKENEKPDNKENWLSKTNLKTSFKYFCRYIAYLNNDISDYPQLHISRKNNSNNIWALGGKEYGSNAPDKIDDFINKGYWKYYGNGTKQIKNIQKVKSGDQVFLKSAGNKGQNREIGFMYIFATGIVKSTDIQNKTLSIDWKKLKDKKTTEHTNYQSSIDRVDKKTNSELIDFIFNSDGQFFDKNEVNKTNDSNKILSNTNLDQVTNSNIANQEISNNIKEKGFLNSNTIFYGVPGCGKSYHVKKLLKTIDNDNNEIKLDEKYYKRILFHPEYTYSDFVGQIIPVVENDRVKYKFEPGPFAKILKAALNDNENQYFLIIEEINRGNAPAIFGDVFQLLDRDENGKSEYEIDNSNILEYLNRKEKNENGEEFTPITVASVYIPSNLTIFATMNTCDQNVFTLDTAFKRRWRMHRIENDFDIEDKFLESEIKNRSGNVLFTWKEFAKAVNDDLLNLNDSSILAEDKQLGTHFVKEFELIDIQVFAEKVLMYLWNDVVKYNKEQLFKSGEDYNTLDKVIKKFVNGENVFSSKNLNNLYDNIKQNTENQSNENNIENIENTIEDEGTNE